MKRILSVFIASLCLFSLVACSSGSNTEDTNSNTQVINNDVTASKENGVNDSLTFEGEVTEETVRNYKVASESDFEVDKVKGGVSITGYLGNDTVVVIPETIGGQTVVNIQGYTFANDSPVRGIMIPSGVKEIYGSFGNNDDLEVVIWESVEKLFENIFLNCPKLHTVVLGDNLTDIEGGAFSMCKSLEELYIPPSVKSLDPETAPTIFFWSDNLTIIGEAGSYIETFCSEQGIPFRAK